MRKRTFDKKLSLFFVVAISVFVFFGTSIVLSKISFKEASYYQKLDDNNVQCELCPRNCFIRLGQRGFCEVRENQEGILYSLVYAQPCSLHIDPIEKKPLFHFLPGSQAFSLATVGCNLKCKFCQNWQISQARPEDVNSISLSPEELIKKVKESNTKIIAYTYTEPTIFYEYMLDIAKLAKREGIKNVMHSAGFINEKPLRELCQYLDGANVDLKGFSQEFYGEFTLGNLDDILRSLKILNEEGVHLEITNLILPGLNDDVGMIRKMCLWIKDNLGKDTPLHLSRFHPMYKLKYLSPTPVATLEKAREIALSVGLRYVYIGNVAGHDAETTYCPKCKKPLIERSGYFIKGKHIKNGSCKYCQEAIQGVWE